MLNIVRQMLSGVPVLTLSGRLDSNGASLLDKESGAMVEENPCIVVDLSNVEYLSSMGIRSLIAMEKSLKALSGGLILTGLNPFVSQVLDLSGLLNRFSCRETLEQAVQSALEYGLRENLGKMTFGDRSYEVTKGTGPSADMEVWGSPPDTVDSEVSKDGLFPVSMEDLGFCFGLGGFGRSRAQAAECPGLFFSAMRLAGLMPADGRGSADFMIVRRPSEAFVHVASGVGFSGEPLLFMKTLDNEGHALVEVLGDALEGVDQIDGPGAPLLGVVIVAEGDDLCGSWYKGISDIPAGRLEPLQMEGGKGALLMGVVTRMDEKRKDNPPRAPHLNSVLETHPIGQGLAFLGHGIGLADAALCENGGSIEECLKELADLNQVRTVFRIEADSRIRGTRMWVFRPSRIRGGEEKLLQVDVETDEEFIEPWEIITRRLYADAGRVILRPIHGGYTAKTFEVDSYGRDGRRWIPTVLKIARAEISRREEAAFRRHVEKTILNNSTSIMGSAGHGEWMGLRYNFVGIGGPGSRLTWLGEHVRSRPVEALIPLFKQLFTGVLKPWYGQPRWEETYLFDEHDPAPLFSRIPEDARRDLSIDPHDESISCAPREGSLPNPYRFLREEFPLRKREARLWYRSICHGDLNMQNVLVDERDNLYVIDYSETGLRNVVSDFARLEAILKIEMTRLENETDLRALMEFEEALEAASALGRTASFLYHGTDPMVPKAYELISLLRSFADRATIFETDMTPYWLALLQWTLPVVSYPSANLLQKRFSAYSAGLLVRNITSRT